MSKQVKFLAAAALLVSATSVAKPAANHGESMYDPGSQYTAILDQTGNRWLLQPANGQDVIIDTGTCSTGAMIPSGVWLLVLDNRGRPELLAPSVTRLPVGGVDHVALRACDKASGRELAVPQSVLDLLTVNTGAIYVDN